MSCGLPLPAQPGDATQALDLTAAAMRANPSIASTATIRRLHKGGGLFSHAADLNALFRRVAEFVDRSVFLIECDQVRQPPQGKLEDALIELQMFRVMDRRPPFILSICVWITPETRSPLSAIRARLGPVTVLVNAAGLDGFKRFANLTFEEWQRVIDVNLNGVFQMTQAVLPDMVEAGWGRIVNISSSSTHSGAPYMAHYVAAKSAVNGLTKSLALEYGPSGITVNAVPPGFIDTPMLRSAEENGFLGDIEQTIARTPVRRMGKPEDIAAACAFLVSEEAGYITGQILGVNGGRNT